MFQQTKFMSVVAVTTIMLYAWLHSGAWAYPNFRDQIPNGYNVRSPCIPIYTVMGVGHRNPFGGGPRNPFGEDFDANNYTWTAELCQGDSDGDGMTNGQELGDPNCTWAVGQIPSRTVRITHPGINNRNVQCLRRFIDFVRGSVRPRPRPPGPRRTTGATTTTTNGPSTTN